MLMGERPTVSAFSNAADVGPWSSGAVAAVLVAQRPRDSSVVCWWSGVWCQTLCICSHMHTRSLNTLQKNKYYHSTHSTLMTHDQGDLTPLALFWSKHIVALPHVPTHPLSTSPQCPLWLPFSESHVFFFFFHRIILKNRAQLDWHLCKWGGCILKGDTIRMGAAQWREASTKGACKFLTCLAYVNEPFSRSDIITTRGYCLWWKYLSRMARLPHGGERSKEW